MASRILARVQYLAMLFVVCVALFWRRSAWTAMWLSSFLCAVGVLGCGPSATEVALRPVQKEVIRNLCWLPEESDPDTEYLVFTGNEGKVVSNKDENEFKLAVLEAGLVFRYDPNTPPKTLTLVPLTRPDAWCTNIPKPTDEAVLRLLDPCAGQSTRGENRSTSKNLLAQSEPTPRSPLFCGKQPQMAPTTAELILRRERNNAYQEAYLQAMRCGNALALAEADMQAVINKSDSWLKKALTDDPGTIEQIQQRLADTLNLIEESPAYDDPILDSIAMAGFKAGFEDGKFEVEAKLFAIDAGVMVLEFAALEIALGPLGGAKLISSAVSKGARVVTVAVGKTQQVITLTTTKGSQALVAAMARLENVPIFLPLANGGLGGVVKVGALTGSISARMHRYWLEQALRAKPFNIFRKAGQALHHIVAHGDWRAENARAKLAQFKIDIDAGWNGVYLPGTKNSPNPNGAIVHSMVHSNQYYDKVDLWLKTAKTRKDAIRVLRRIRETLEDGTFFDANL